MLQATCHMTTSEGNKMFMAVPNGCTQREEKHAGGGGDARMAQMSLRAFAVFRHLGSEHSYAFWAFAKDCQVNVKKPLNT